MTDILYIRLGSQQHNIVHWLIWSLAEKAVIEQGELDSANATDLSTLTSKAEHRKVVVLVPGSDVTLKALKVPGKSQRAIRLAAPFMLEDDLAQDVEQLFFAYGNINEDEKANNCFVAAVDKQLMSNWLLWLADADIKTKMMLPDVLAMPINSNDSEHTQVDDIVKHYWNAVTLGDQILFRQSPWKATVVDKSFWSVVSQSWQNKSVTDKSIININAYSKLPPIEGANIIAGNSNETSGELSPLLSIDKAEKSNSGIYITEVDQLEHGLALIAEHCENQPVLNLLQGEFKVVQKRSPALTNWFWAAGFVVVALIFNIAFKGIALINKENTIANIEQEIIKTYKSTFPKTQRVRINTIKSQLKAKMKDIGSASESDKFLPMMNDLQPAFSMVSDLTIESLKFDGKKEEVRLQVTGSSFQSFEKFTAAVKKMGMDVKQGAQNNNGDRISGSFSITRTGGK